MIGFDINMKTSIKLLNISKEYYIHHEKPTLVEKFIKGRDERFLALKNISLTFYEGQKIGLMGLNGCGKTTLLKIIAGVTSPTKGNRTVYGRLISLIDLDAGFQPDLTGEQNIYLNGMLLGIKKHDIDRSKEAIIDYADIKQFIDAPLYTYSQGMKLRLGISIAINSYPDILVIDEGLGVGDKQFQNKVIHTLKTQFADKTIIIANHDPHLISRLCNRIIILNQGGITHDGGLQNLKLYAA